MRDPSAETTAAVVSAAGTSRKPRICWSNNGRNKQILYEKVSEEAPVARYTSLFLCSSARF